MFNSITNSRARRLADPVRKITAHTLLEMAFEIMEKIFWSVAIGLFSAFVSFKLLEQKLEIFMTYQTAINGAIYERVNRIENCVLNRTCTK